MIWENGDVISRFFIFEVPLKKRGKRILDSGCSKHMTEDKILLTNITFSDGGSVTFGDNSKGYIIGKGNEAISCGASSSSMQAQDLSTRPAPPSFSWTSSEEGASSGTSHGRGRGIS